jgi:hypothetical protein
MVGLDANNDMGNSFSVVTSATLEREPAVGITQRWNPGRNPWRTGWYRRKAA